MAPIGELEESVLPIVVVGTKPNVELYLVPVEQEPTDDASSSIDWMIAWSLQKFRHMQMCTYTWGVP